MAVARYYFNIRNGHGFTADDEGTDLSSKDEARAHAIIGARSLLSAEVLEGMLDLNGQIEMMDERGQLVMTVHYTEALEVHPADQSMRAAQ